VTYDAAATWRAIPVDDVGYFTGADLLAKSDDEFLSLMATMEDARYSTGKYRNHGNLWVTELHDGLEDTTVCDWGCGVGLEALKLSERGNRVRLVDINPESIAVATRLLRLHGYEPYDGPYDVFFANGSLHHVPEPAPVLQQAADQGATQMRLMLYSDKAWEAHGPERFAAAMDFEATYATYYTPERLTDIVPAGWTVTRWTYITSNGFYAAARVEAS
jgi:SAM-dependent methyltransferase